MREKLEYNRKINAFVKSHNLVNRIYDMVLYFGVLKKEFSEEKIKRFFLMSLEDAEYVETLTKFFEKKMQKHKKNIDLRCNLRDLIYDLEYLKQYLI